MIKQPSKTKNQQHNKIAKSTNKNNIAQPNFISNNFSQKILGGALFAIFVALNLANAEVSGVFAGFQVGYGDLAYNKENRVGGIRGVPYNHTVSEMQYGGILGYKHFFSDKFGFRLGAYFTYTNPRFIDDENQKQDITVMSYGGAFDVLLNAISKPNVDAGFFGGFYLGAKTYDSNRLSELEAQWRQAQATATQTATQTIQKTHLDVGANLGFRLHYMKYNGMEIGVSIPFIEHLLYQRSASNVGINLNYRHSVKSNYAVYFRYTLSINTSKANSTQQIATKNNAKSSKTPNKTSQNALRSGNKNPNQKTKQAPRSNPPKNTPQKSTPPRSNAPQNKATNPQNRNINMRTTNAKTSSTSKYPSIYNR